MEYSEKFKYIVKNFNNKKARQRFDNGDVVTVKDNGGKIKATVVCQKEGMYKTIITTDNGKTYHEVLTKKLKKYVQN